MLRAVGKKTDELATAAGPTDRGAQRSRPSRKLREVKEYFEE
jgi:hypothetical protein